MTINQSMSFYPRISKYLCKWVVIALFLMIGVIAHGCASTSGARKSGDAGNISGAVSKSEKLPFPYSRGTTGIEPTVVSYRNYRDPLIGPNRFMFAFNDVTYRYLLIPLGKGYIRVVPKPVRKSVGNFFFNIKTPVYVVNDLLQAKFKPLGRNLLRFGINTTLGLLGFFDPAKAWFHLEAEENHFERTLSHYGAGYGIYLVLPILGPSDIRNSLSTVADYFLNPIIYLTEDPARTTIQASDYFQEFAPNSDRYITLRRKSDDPYIFFRNLYLQGVQRNVDY